MAMTSYDVEYVENAAVNVGTMFEYAVAGGYEPAVFWNMFVSSYAAEQIEKGNPKFLAGCSAIDLVGFVLKADVSAVEDKTPDIKPFFDRPRCYWAGWILTRYQNRKDVSFYYINKAFPIEKVLLLYDTLHEADETRFFETADAYLDGYKAETNLKRIRKAAGLSQKQLAERADVSVRNIQMYEQRKNDINKAQADTLYRLAKILGCNIEDLFEMR